MLQKCDQATGAPHMTPRYQTVSLSPYKARAGRVTRLSSRPTLWVWDHAPPTHS